MKTTIEIADSLLDEARSVAAKEGLTLRALVEDGLREALRRRRTMKPFRMRDAAFQGEGLQKAFAEADWHAIRGAAYVGRGT